MIHAPGKLVAAVGLQDMVVIETGDALLICPKARSQDVKLIVERQMQGVQRNHDHIKMLRDQARVQS